MPSAETWTAIGTVAMAVATFVVVLQGLRNRRDDERRYKDGFRPICVLTPYDGVDPRPWRNELLAVDTDASRPGFGIIEINADQPKDRLSGGAHVVMPAHAGIHDLPLLQLSKVMDA